MLPLALTVRATNVYEERSLGIYAEEEDEENKAPSTVLNYVGWQ